MTTLTDAELANAKWEFDQAIERMVARHIYVTQYGVLPDETDLRRVQAEIHAERTAVAA